MRRVLKQKKTTLLYCEGNDEVILAEYIKKCSRSRRHLRIKNGHGGSPVDTVWKAIKERDGYDEVYVWVDTDRREILSALKLAESYKIPVIKNKGNLEASILSLLFNFPEARLGNAKKAYMKKYPKDLLGEEKTYKKFFPNVQSIRKAGGPFLHIYDIIK